jgi:hypothetical protein
MTIEDDRSDSLMLPFLLRFKNTISESARTLRYDMSRQISEVLVDGKWIDGCDRSAPSLEMSRFTRVERETSDDA